MLKDNRLDEMMKDIIDIFMTLEGVELVRLSGITRRSKKISGMDDLNEETLDKIIRKLKENNIIYYQFITHCPHCGETSYQIKDYDITKPKLCDTCKTMFNLINSSSLEV